MASDVIARMDLVISLAEGELSAQVTQEAGADTKAVGLAGLAGALLIAIVATRGNFGRFWWLPFAGFLFAAIFAMLSLFTDPLKTGPSLPAFYGDIKTESEEAAKSKAIEDLFGDLGQNRQLLEVKNALLQRTILLFAGTLVVSIPVLLATSRG